MPPEIVDNIRQDPASSTSYFNLWLQHGEDWSQVQVAESRTSADSNATAKKRQWMYACQIHAKWPNEAVARRKKEEASSSTATWRAGTKFPEHEYLLEYKVLVDDEETKTHEDRWEKGVNISAELDSSQGRVVLPAMGSPTPKRSPPLAEEPETEGTRRGRPQSLQERALLVDPALARRRMPAGSRLVCVQFGNHAAARARGCGGGGAAAC
jgi:hypothetical protein